MMEEKPGTLVTYRFDYKEGMSHTTLDLLF